MVHWLVALVSSFPNPKFAATPMGLTYCSLPPATGIHYIVPDLDIKSRATAKRLDREIADYLTLHHLMSHVSLICTSFKLINLS